MMFPIVETTVWITGRITGSIVCTVEIMLVRAGTHAPTTCWMVVVIPLPNETSCGISGANPAARDPSVETTLLIPEINSGTAVMAALNPFSITGAIEGNISLSPSFNPTTISLPSVLIFGTAFLTPVLTTLGSDENTRPIIGTALSNKNVDALSTNCSIDPVTSPPIAIFPRRFFAAAFIAENEPLKVCPASFAVVPVTPSSF